MKKHNIFIFIALLTCSVVNGQDKSRQELLSLKNRFYSEYLQNQAAVKDFVKKTRVPERWSAGEKVFQIQKLDASGKPVVINTESNVEAANSTGASAAWTGGSLGLNLNGQGMIIGEWDGGAVLRTHQEFTTNRVVQVDGATTVSSHATHVAGTLIGNGTSASAKGMMHQGTLWAHDWNNDQSEMANAALNGLRVSNHSYGWLTGWSYNSSQASWYWYGSTTTNATTDNLFGFYNSTAQQWDQVAFNAPNYLIVKSAGNDRGEGPAAGTSHFAWNGSAWATSTATRDRDGGTTGYDCMSYSSVSKNILTIGAVNRIAAGYSGPSSVVMSSFSSWGPTDDGRIKPDIVGAGVGLASAYTPNNNSYASLSGTSMAGPNVAGSLGLVQQHSQNVRGSMLLGATLKGLAIHTAHEAGPANGPDYMFGWGLLNTAGCINAINSTQSSSGIFENTLTQGSNFEISVYNDGTTPLQATISWYDPAGPVNASNSFNDRTARLVNDLDLRIIRVSDGNTELPWMLNPDVPSAAATKGDNIKDNVEKVSLLNPVSGWYTIRVTHKGTLIGNQQNYSLIYTGGSLSQTCSEPTAGGNASGPSSLTEGVAGNFVLTGFSGSSVQWQSSTDQGTNWNNISGASSPSSAISLAQGTYQIRAAVSRINCTTAFSNVLNVSVNPLTGNTLNNPFIVTLPYSGNVSTASGSGFTNNYTGANNQASPDVFFRITTGPCTDSLAISTCASGFDTYLHLLDASGLNIASVDDDGPFCAGTRASIKRLVSPNTTYFIVAEGYGTSTGTINITINGIDNPVFNASVTANGPTTFCSGGSVVLTASSGNSYLWNTGATTQSITANAAGNYAVTVSDANGCTASASLQVSVNNLPLAYNVSGGGTYCTNESGAVVSLSGTQPGVNYEFFLNSNELLATIAGTGNPVSASGLNGSGTITVKAVNATTGCFVNMNNTVSISPQTPASWYLDADGDGYGTAATSQLACIQPAGYVGNNTDCDDSNNSVFSTFSFYADADGDGFGAGNLIDGICASGAGSPPAGYSTNNSDCAPDDNNKWQSNSLFIDSDGDGYDAGTAVVCYGSSVPTGFRTSSLGNDCNDNASAINPGATEICGNGIDDNCNGSTDENCITYTWYRDSDGDGYGTASLSTTTFVNTAPSGYVSNNTDCNDASAAVNPAAAEICNGIDDNCDGTIDNGTPALPGTGNMIGTGSVCRSTSGNVYSIDPVAGATAYTWTLPTGATGTSTTNSISVAFSSTFAGGSICVTPRNNCLSSSQRCMTLSVVSAVPAQPSTISGAAAGVCSTATQTYTVVPVSGATSYNWTVPANSSIVSGQGSNQIVLQFASAFASGTLSVTARNCLGTSTARTLALSRNTAVPASITGPLTAVCGGSQRTYSTAAITGATIYTWTVPTGAVINSGQGTNSITITFPNPFTSGAVTVKSGTACFSSTARSITVYAAPVSPASITGSSVGVCAGSTQTYTCPASTTGATFYTWTVPTGATLNSGQGTTSVSVTFPAGFLTGNVAVTASNSCGTSTARTLAVRSATAQPGTITGTSLNLCSGGSFTYSIAAVTGASSYSWTAPAGCTITANTGTSITMTIPAGFVSGTLSVVANNSCGASVARTLALSGIPATPASITGPASVCASAAGLAYSTPVVSGVTTYNWTVPAGASITTGAGTNAITVKWGTVAGAVSVRAGNACGTNSTARSLSVALAACREAMADAADSKDEIRVYPNPGNGQYNLIIGGLEGHAMIRIYNAIGVMVDEIECSAIENLSELNLVQYPSGMYLVKIQGAAGTKSELRLIKQ